MATKQVGGTHYQSEYQHWDWVEDSGMGYLEGCATKYIARWGDKGDGENDLKKARSYVTKLIERHNATGRNNRGAMTRLMFSRFCHANEITDPLEIGACLLLGLWSDVQQLYAARDMITDIISKHFPAQSKVSTSDPFGFSEMPAPVAPPIDSDDMPF